MSFCLRSVVSTFSRKSFLAKHCALLEVTEGASFYCTAIRGWHAPLRQVLAFLFLSSNWNKVRAPALEAVRYHKAIKCWRCSRRQWQNEQSPVWRTEKLSLGLLFVLPYMEVLVWELGLFVSISQTYTTVYISQLTWALMLSWFSAPELLLTKYKLICVCFLCKCHMHMFGSCLSCDAMIKTAGNCLSLCHYMNVSQKWHFTDT